MKTDDPVMPLAQLEKAAAYSVFPFAVQGPNGTFTFHGISKRELFAAMMAQAILTGAVTRGCPSNEWIDQSMAVKCADTLLTALRVSEDSK